jgi:hypothetical protein
MLRKVAGAALILLGIAMIYLGINAGILPPTITGIGFFVIALVFLLDKPTT